MDSETAGTLTFLFTDIEGSTRLWEQYPEAMKGALRRHDEILRSAIEAAHGQVVKATGDGMMAIFDSAGNAASASLEAARGLLLESWGETGPLRVRIGLHAGRAEVRAGDYFGPAVNRTARIMAAGHGGQILLSAAAAALAVDGLPAGASLLDLGEHRLRDLGRPERVFQLVHGDLPADFPALGSLGRETGNLPARASGFIGRRAERAAIAELLIDPEIRLTTLTGPGGTGKTTLAIRTAEDVARHFPDGVFFVDLAPARDVGAFYVALARAIGLDEVGERSLVDDLTHRLRDRRALLVFDNFEQVSEAGIAVAELLRDCPGLNALVTSREALHIRAEHVYPVPPLGLPPTDRKAASIEELERYEAVELFIDRAKAVRDDFRLTKDNAQAVVEICRRLDGLPLAIELAAARLQLFSPEALQDRLGNRLALLRSGPRDLPERQQTLRATIDWSHELLEPAEQRLFELLAVFAGATIPAIEAVVAAIGSVDGVELDPL
ncbi:MAG: adenylate/guanylate cyclase domain-containing protein, partial [Candidatus Limnocylindrales bacterium]